MLPRKCALFGSDGPDSMSSSSDAVEGHYLEPPDDGYPVATQSGLPHENDSREEAWSPSRRLEVAVARLQKENCGLPEGDQSQQCEESGDPVSAHETVGIYVDATSQIFGEV